MAKEKVGQEAKEKTTRQVMVVFDLENSEADKALLERLDGITEETGVTAQRILKVAITDPDGLDGAERRAVAWYAARRAADLAFELGEDVAAPVAAAPEPEAPAADSGQAEAKVNPAPELPSGVTLNAEGHRVKGKIKEMLAKHGGECARDGCDKALAEGELIIYDTGHRKAYCVACGEPVLLAA